MGKTLPEGEGFSCAGRVVDPLPSWWQQRVAQSMLSSLPVVVPIGSSQMEPVSL